MAEMTFLCRSTPAPLEQQIAAIAEDLEVPFAEAARLLHDALTRPVTKPLSVTFP